MGTVAKKSDFSGPSGGSEGLKGAHTLFKYVLSVLAALHTSLMLWLLKHRYTVAHLH